ncbi:Rieske (2Fe-2S) protein [Candidatus Zixiibacteriota bacterium]
MVEAVSSSDFPEGSYQRIETPDGSWIVVRTEDGFHAVRDRCGHFPQSMQGARLTGFQWRCPHHGVTYDIRTGEVVDDVGFVDIDPLTTAPCLVSDDGMVLIDIEIEGQVTD